MKICIGLLIVACLALAGLAQESKPTGRIGGAPSDAGTDIIKGRIGGAPSDAGAETISGRVGGGAATDAGAGVVSGRGGASTNLGSGRTARPGLSGDPFTSRGSLGNTTNVLGATNRVNVIVP